MKKLWLLLALFILSISAAGCAASSSSPTTPSAQPIAIEYLDGKADIAVDSTYKATFSSAVDPDTVTTSTFFIVKTESALASISPFKATADVGICDPANALPGTVTVAATYLSATLVLNSALANGTTYTVCLINVKYADGTTVTSFSATFNSAASAGAALSLIVVDVKGNPVATTGTTDIAASPIFLLFSEDMDVTSVTTTGNVTMTCQRNIGTVTPEITVAKAEVASVDANGQTIVTLSERSYKVTVTKDYEYQLLDCTLTVTTNVKTKTGTALASASEYVYESGCAVRDVFNGYTQPCWTVLPSSAGQGTTYSTWEELNNVGGYPPVMDINNTVDEENEGLLFYMLQNEGAAKVILYKEVYFDTTGFDISIDIEPWGSMGLDTEEISVTLQSDWDGTIALKAGLAGRTGALFLFEQLCQASWTDATDGTVTATSAVPCPFTVDIDTYVIRITADTTNGVTASYAVSGGAAVPLTPGVGVFPTAANINTKLLQYAGQPWLLTVVFNKTFYNLIGYIRSVDVTGVKSTDQY